MNDNIDLSIVVATYNQEKYVKKAIDSILGQKTKYKYEVWIGDDCSTDRTQEILSSIQKTVPSYFHFILRKKNIGADKNFEDLYNRTNGKYLAVLEGDDYWISHDKIQKQIDFLEEHNEYIATAHNVSVVDKNGNINNKYLYPECKEHEYTLKHFREGILAGQTASIVSRNYYKYDLFTIFKPSVEWAGDRTRNFLLASHGKVYCFQSCMSAYRYVNQEGDSYSATFKKNEDTEYRYLQYHKELYEYSLKYIKSKESIKISESLYLKLYLAAVVKRKVKNVSVREWLELLMNSCYPLNTLKYIIGRSRL